MISDAMRCDGGCGDGDCAVMRKTFAMRRAGKERSVGRYVCCTYLLLGSDYVRLGTAVVVRHALT
jgi:hypothetical protein